MPWGSGVWKAGGEEGWELGDGGSFSFALLFAAACLQEPCSHRLPLNKISVPG